MTSTHLSSIKQVGKWTLVRTQVYSLPGRRNRGEGRSLPSQIFADTLILGGGTLPRYYLPPPPRIFRPSYGPPMMIKCGTVSLVFNRAAYNGLKSILKIIYFNKVLYTIDKV